MSKHSWYVNTDENLYMIVLDHNYWTTQQVISVNDNVVVDKTPMSNLQNKHFFDIDGHQCCVIVGRRFLVVKVKYTLLFDGVEVPEVNRGSDLPFKL